MARRSDHSRDELMEMIVKTGHKQIESEGFARFSARKVAGEIGYTVGTVYHLFENHENLILHINARTLDEWYEDLERMLAKSKKAPTFEDLALYYVSYSAAHYNTWMALFEHTLPAGTELPEWYKPKMKRFFDLLEEMILPITGNDKRETRRAARVLWAGIHGICLLSHSGKLDLVGSESAQILAKSFVETYLRGIQRQ